MTMTICDPWVERHIAAGRLSPGARGLTRENAATQYNRANGLVSSDEDYLYTPVKLLRPPASCWVTSASGSTRTPASCSPTRGRGRSAGRTSLSHRRSSSPANNTAW